MSHTPKHFLLNPLDTCWLVIVLLVILLTLPQLADSAVYGVRDKDGVFVPKITVTIKPDQIVISKYDKKEKFSSISFTVNKDNSQLVRNIHKLKIQWIAPGAVPRSELPFIGRRFDENRMVYKDRMTRSIGVKIKNKTDPALFKNKRLSDLFTIHVNGLICEPQDALGAPTDDGTIRLGEGSGGSIEIDKETIRIESKNLQAGVLVNIRNRSASDLKIGVTFPKVGLMYTNILRTLDQSKLPPKEWERFTLAKDNGIILAVIADPDDPNQLAQLNGSQIIVKIWDGDRIKETKSIAIEVDPELVQSAGPAGPQPPSGLEPGVTQPSTGPNEITGSVTNSGEEPPPAPKPEYSPKQKAAVQESSGTLWLWLFQIFNFTLLITLAGYGIFFMLPKIQVLEDRLAKSEMFIHGSREAIREELDEIKREILQQCRIQSGQE